VASPAGGKTSALSPVCDHDLLARPARPVHDPVVSGTLGGGVPGRRGGSNSDRLTRHLKEAGLPAFISDIAPPRPATDALLAAMGHDKKVKDGKLTFILVRGLGRAFVTSDVPLDAVKDVLNA